SFRAKASNNGRLLFDTQVSLNQEVFGGLDFNEEILTWKEHVRMEFDDVITSVNMVGDFHDSILFEFAFNLRMCCTTNLKRYFHIRSVKCRWIEDLHHTYQRLSIKETPVIYPSDVGRF